jgi:hypothetical protein
MKKGIDFEKKMDRSIMDTDENQEDLDEMCEKFTTVPEV